MTETEARQISLTDPGCALDGDERPRQRDRRLQCAESPSIPSHHLIVAHEVTNVGSRPGPTIGHDRARRRLAIGSARPSRLLADRGYLRRRGDAWPASRHRRHGLSAEADDLRPLRPKGASASRTSSTVARKTSICVRPVRQLTYRYTNGRGRQEHCVRLLDHGLRGLRAEEPVHEQARSGGSQRWEHEAVLEVVQARLDRKP